MTDVPDTLTRFRGELEGAAARDLDRRRRRRKTLRPAVATAVFVSAGAVAAAFLLVGGGPSIVDKAQAALVAQPGSILHMKTTLTRSGPDGSVSGAREEDWQQGGTARRTVEVFSDGHVLETATAGRVAQLYDPATNTIYTDDVADLKARLGAGGRPVTKVSKPAAATPATKQLPPKAKVLAPGVKEPQTPDEKIRLLLDSGQLAEDGHVSVDGRDAVRLASADGSVTYLVDAGTFAPIEWRSQQQGGAVTLRFEVYETLPATTENEALVSLTAQHPGATVDSDPAHFAAVLGRLSPAKD